MQIPSHLRYTTDHEWLLAVDNDTYRIGITDYAQDQLGDLVFVDTGQAGTSVAVGGVIAEVESTKSVGEIYAPTSVEVIAVNETLVDHPELINSDPYGEGWLVEVRLTAPLPDTLLDADGYRALVE